MFRLLKTSNKSKARLTRLTTSHGLVDGPFFMPIATKGAVKNLTTEELEVLRAQIVLANTYHLFLAPGSKLIKKAGGLRRYMNWPGPILTDSGGFQVFSLSKIRKIDEQGVIFSDPRGGHKYRLTPELSVQIQKDLGVDIAMAFDDVIGYPATKEKVKLAMERTSRWAKRCLTATQKHESPLRPSASTRNRDEPASPRGERSEASTKTQKPMLFGIIQGGIYKDLRLKSAKDLIALNFDGYAIGGVAVGEPREKMKPILNWVVPLLPENKPRYLMGLGKPEEIVQAVKEGIDMFDCVIPTREARHGRLYLWRQEIKKSKNQEIKLSGTFYQTINIANSRYKTDLTPINQTNLKQYSKAYLHHLFATNEPLGMRLATLNNLEFYLSLMREIRGQIKAGKL